MNQKIYIRNFAGIKEIEVPLNSINLIIGKQASGKSITAKLIYFFKKIFNEFYEGYENGNTKSAIDKVLLRKFKDFFPPDRWYEDGFKIEYFWGSESILILKEKNKSLKIIYSDQIRKALIASRRIFKNEKKLKEQEYLLSQQTFINRKNFYDEIYGYIGVKDTAQVFIPAGRSFFAVIQSSIFSLLSINSQIDPFLINFGSYYEMIKGIPFALPSESKLDKQIYKKIFDIIESRHIRDKNKDYLVHKDARKVNISFASSGQQEALPLVLVLKSLTTRIFGNFDATVFIEEPEAHLFPIAQKKIVELISMVYNTSKSNLQFIVTTHSPYIMTSFNNLLQAGHALSDIDSNSNDPNKDRKKLFGLVPENEIIDPNKVNSFSMSDGNIENIMDEETGLMLSEILDEVSEDIAVQFDDILDISR